MRAHAGGVRRPAAPGLEEREAPAPRRARAAVPFVALWAVVALLTSAHALVAAAPADGDEPHYLLITRSLLDDRDLDLADDYADEQQVLDVYPQGRHSPLSAETHAGRYGGSEELVPIHGIAVPLVLVPPLAAGGGTRAARVWMALLSALTWPLLLAVLDRVLPGRRTASAVALLAVALTLPWLPYASQLFPEPVGALLGAVALWCLVTAGSRRRLLAGAVAAAALPWVHVRFAILAAALIAGLLWRAVGAATPAAALRTLAARPAGALAVLAPPLVSATGLLAYNAALYGSPSPNAAYQVEPFLSAFRLTPEGVYRWGAADLLSPVFGVLPYGPVLVLALAGLGVLLVRLRWAAALAIGTIVAYYLVAAALGKDGGWCPPGRFACVFVPFLAVPLAAALGAGRRAWMVFAPLAAYGAVIAVAATARFPALYTSQVDRPLLGPVRAAAPAWPAFPHRLPDRMARDLPGAEAPVQGGAGAEHELLGGGLRPGTYQVSLEVERAATGDARSPAAHLVVVDGDDEVLAAEPVPSGRTSSTVRTTFGVHDDPVAKVRLRTPPGATLVLGAVVVEPAAPGAAPQRPLAESAPLVAVWLALLAALGTALLPARAAVPLARHGR